jgi:DegV family protein with EDD domain
MAAIKIVTDSTADLGPELTARYGITVVPLTVQFDQESYLDGVEIDTQKLFSLVEENKRLPKTASPSPGAFHAAFAAATADGSDVIFIGISSKFSSTVQNARIAADMLPDGRVSTFDSANLSTGIGLLVLLAADMARAGSSRAEILAALEDARPKVRSAFMIDTLEYLHKGGRCSGVQALAGALLHIRPIIAVVDGGMVVAGKTRGARQKALDALLERLASDVEAGAVRPERVFITHTGVHEDALYLADGVRRLLPGVGEVLETPAGSVVGSHCGPGTIGVLYVVK